ncbi:MAG: hypothetical protein IKE42_27690 [Aquamicrobium sp.]|jgi:hypothetical protein|uniref:hypothetical protein n=1 Tax=Mesorhizobium TaxID=68287 RepID=UPI0010117EDD|nr:MULTISPECIES: hypothetical protein [Mesorhizobium]MBR2691656.1 hypothetical protein [Aquamicrobium sp.]QAZ46477.1 hypothetical protein C1M53_29705 [Mesorhizobium sp. Pch-S]
MHKTIGYALIIVAATATGAFANSGSNPTNSELDRILQGHGSAGEAAGSVSNPDISYRVLANGDLEKTNTRYNRVEIVKPSWSQGQRASWAGRR